MSIVFSISPCIGRKLNKIPALVYWLKSLLNVQTPPVKMVESFKLSIKSELIYLKKEALFDVIFQIHN